MIYSIYNQTTGQILRVVNTDDINVQVNQGESYIEGSYDDTKYYIDISNSKPIEISEKPSSYSEFNYITKQWVLNSQKLIRDVRIRRQQLLAGSDWTDTLSAKTRLGDILYNQWQIYRQQLRDVTDQSGYPLNVVWPIPPSSTTTT